MSKPLSCILVLGGSLKCPTSGLWLPADHCYLVMASGRAGSNQVGGIKERPSEMQGDCNGDQPRRMSKLYH